jgi:DNA gyrase/topoisomerase IV subunit A
MHAFNSKGVITKYATLNDILIEFATVRKELYETRRQHQVRTLQSELPHHTNIVRFILDQISDTPSLNLRKKTRTECDVILKQALYAELEGGYEYIMRLPVSAFTAEMIAKHRKQLETIEAEIARLQKETASSLWLADLDKV